jgi:glycerol-3-phosphate acyltransferase PlsX
MLPLAIDAMGGDFAPSEIIAGARRAHDEFGIPILLVGRPDELGDVGPLEVLAASEVIAMDAEPGSSVRRLTDSSLVVAAKAVKDGRASAMISAGNTGAAMASALLKMGRIRGVGRPAIATPIPRPGGLHPTILLDAGANAECRPEWLVQFGQMGAVLARGRFGVAEPRVGLLSIGEEAGKGNPFVKETFELMAALDWEATCGARFVGNVEGRDLMAPTADVVVTDGFTGNVALKTLEGGVKAIIASLLEAFDTDDVSRAAARQLLPALAPLYETFNPDSYGGAMLLGVDGVCVISHGSSKANAMVNACRVAAEMVEVHMVDQLRATIRHDRDSGAVVSPDADGG